MSRRLLLVDVLKEVRRALRVLRRVEAYLVQQERHATRTAQKNAERERDREYARLP